MKLFKHVLSDIFTVLLFIGLLPLLLLSSVAYSTTYYVAQSGGSDGNPGNQSAPFQTIQHCATTAVTGDTCLIRAGTYRETVTPVADGVTYAPDGSVTPIVSGADVVNGWTVHRGTIYQSAGMTWTMPGTGNNQVFVDGVMMNLARFPNASLDVSHPTFLTAEGGLPTNFNVQNYQPWVIQDSHLVQPTGFWVGAEVTLWASGMYSQAGLVTASSPGSITFTNLHTTQQRSNESPYGVQYPYYLSNLLGALDTSGEWYFDGSTLYLWTPQSDNPSSHTVEAKRRQWAFDLSNRSHITIQNLGIFAASINTNNASSHNILDGITVTYVWHQLRNLPDPAIGQFDAKWGAWETGIRLNGSDNILRNCTIAYSSHNGVYLHGTHQTVTNCTIHDVDYLASEGGAVSWMGDDPSGASPHSSGHTVTWNTMHTSGRSIVLHYYASGVTISHNLMYDACLTTGDCGITYRSKPGDSGTMAYNILHDDHAPYWNHVLYMDADPTNWLVHHNVVYNGADAIGINIGDPATNLQIYNNTVWNVGDTLAIYSSGPMTNVKVWNNLVRSGIHGSDTANNLELATPGFVDANHGNFQLASGSPAINAGRVIPGITDGFVGSAPDVGAYEFGAPPWTAGVTPIPKPPSPLLPLAPPTNFRVLAPP